MAEVVVRKGEKVALFYSFRRAECRGREERRKMKDERLKLLCGAKYGWRGREGACTKEESIGRAV